MLRGMADYPFGPYGTVVSLGHYWAGSVRRSNEAGEWIELWRCDHLHGSTKAALDCSGEELERRLLASSNR